MPACWLGAVTPSADRRRSSIDEQKRSRPPGGAGVAELSIPITLSDRPPVRPNHGWEDLKFLIVIDSTADLPGFPVAALQVWKYRHDRGAAQLLPTAHPSADGQWPGVHRQRSGSGALEVVATPLTSTRFT